MINYTYSVCTCHIYITALILGYAADAQRRHTAGSVPFLQFMAVKHINSGVVGSDPEPFTLIEIKASDAGDRGSDIRLLKGVAVISKKSGIGPDPDKTFTCLGNGIDLGNWKTVVDIVENCRIFVAVCYWVNCRVIVDIARGIFGQNLA